jgi:hypothetical protein
LFNGLKAINELKDKCLLSATFGHSRFIPLELEGISQWRNSRSLPQNLPSQLWTCGPLTQLIRAPFDYFEIGAVVGLLTGVSGEIIASRLIT